MPDRDVGDGTTSVVLAGELLQQCKEFVEEGVAPQIIIKGFKNSCFEKQFPGFTD